ncbi:MAG: DNA polymerase III subunit alpha [Lentisphaeraceae bacterium]|nr:DNA polymerase III subunit alpha [Lentisphaeraceae bacterium]
MSEAKFVHLNAHTDYSMLQAACPVKKLVAKAKEFGMNALALTDYGNLCGTVDFYNATTGADIKPIIGCTVFVASGKYTDKNYHQEKPSGYSLVLLAKDFEGYQNICRLNAHAHLEGFHMKPRVDKELLAKYNSGLIALSACRNGEVYELLKKGNTKRAEKVSLELKEIYGVENFYMEIQDHGFAEEKEIVKQMIDIARAKDIPLVATNDVHYLDTQDAEAHDLLVCIGEKRTVNEENRPKFVGDQYYFRSQEEMIELFKDYPEAISNTVKIADQCKVDLDFETNHYPVYELEDGSDKQPEYLRQVCLDNILRCYEWEYKEGMELSEEQQVIIERLDFELEVIIRTGFASYFLVVWDFIMYSREEGIPVGPGRGSGAGSIVAFLLSITNLDPIKYDLLFERFLNPERISPPDFDIDFCERRRYDVIEYVRKKYGTEKVAQIGTYGTLKAKAVIKDVTRALGFNHTDADRITKTLPNHPKLTLKKALDPGAPDNPNELFSPDFRNMYENESWVKQIIDQAFKLEGLNRQMGIHAAGVIIGDQPLTNLVPLIQGQNEGEAVTQYSGGPCEDLGLLKMDFLGLRTLTVIDDAVKLVKKGHGIDMDIEKIPIDDPKTYKLFQEGRTVAVFQYESAGMQKWMKLLKPTVFPDLIAMNALYRPGPMEYIPTFIARKHGEEPIIYAIDDMSEYLEETYGVTVYQEQVMLLSQSLGGFTKGEADTLRKAMGKKKMDLLDMLKPKFLNQGAEKGYDKKQLESIWVSWEAFAAYAFNKSHSTCYAWVAYQTAYLKSHYPAEFMAAVLTSELGNAEKVAFFIHECKEIGIQIENPNVNLSQVSFDVFEGKLLYGLAAIKGVGTAAAEAIVRVRNENGKFEDFSDFCEKVEGGVNRRVMENLVKAGAFDCFGIKRSCLFAMIEPALQRAQSTANDRASGQGSLFDMLSDEDLADSKLDVSVPDLPEWHDKERLDNEKQLLGFYATGHPLGQFAQIIKKYSTVDLIRIKQESEEQGIKFGAMILSVMMKTTKKDGRAWAILVVEDLSDSIECLCFPDTFEECKNYISSEAPVFIEGVYSYKEEDDTRKIIVRKIIPMTDAVSAYTTEVHVRFTESQINEDSFNKLKCLISKRRQQVNDYEKLELIKAAMVYFDKSEADFAAKFAGYLEDTMRPIVESTQMESLLKSPRFGCMNSETSFLAPEQKDYLVRKLKEIKFKNPLILCVQSLEGDLAFIEAGPAFKLNASWEMINEIKELFGEKAVHLKADKSVPEVRRRQFFKKAKAS